MRSAIFLGAFLIAISINREEIFQGKWLVILCVILFFMADFMDFFKKTEE